MIDYIIAGIVAALLALVIVRMVKTKKAGGGCAGCSGCAASHTASQQDCGGCAHHAQNQ